MARNLARTVGTEGGNAPPNARFTPDLLAREPPSGLDVVTTLRHFAIASYAIDPERLARHLHPRFLPDTLELAPGRPKALLSVVPFLDIDFPGPSPQRPPPTRDRVHDLPPTAGALRVKARLVKEVTSA